VAVDAVGLKDLFACPALRSVVLLVWLGAEVRKHALDQDHEVSCRSTGLEQSLSARLVSQLRIACLGDRYEADRLVVAEHGSRRLRTANRIDLEPVVLRISIWIYANAVAVQVDAVVLDETLLLRVQEVLDRSCTRDIKDVELETKGTTLGRGPVAILASEVVAEGLDPPNLRAA